jgi:ABC-type sugar transport system permease subunit
MKWTDRSISLLLILPAIVNVIAFAFYPIIYAVYESFQTNSRQNVLSNYIELPSFGLNSAIFNTVVVTAAALAFQFVLGFAIANILTKQFTARSVFYTSMIIPFASSTVVAAWIFGNIFTTGQGSYANSFLHLLGLPPVNWTGIYCRPPTKLR